MKKILKSALLLVLVSSTIVAMAQSETKEKKEKMTREQFAEVQATYIAYELAFDDTTTEKFIKTFCDYQKEIWALGPRHNKKTEPANEAEAEEAIKANFEQSLKILTIRDKYYTEYSKFLTQRQIQRVYELERKTMKRLSDHHDNKHTKKNNKK